MPTEAAQDEGTEKARTLPASKSGVASHRMATGILLLGLVVTGTLSWIIYTVNLRNEQRLLTTQTKETGTVLEVVLPALQTPLASAAEIAATSDGSSTAFRRYITSYVGPTGTFDSASLWSLSATTPRMVVDVGQAPILASSPRKVATFLPTAAHTPLLSVIGLLTGSRQRIGYAFASSGAGIRYVVYGESVVPTNKREALQEGSPFADLRYAVYLGRTRARTPYWRRALARSRSRPRMRPTSCHSVPMRSRSSPPRTAHSGGRSCHGSGGLWQSSAVFSPLPQRSVPNGSFDDGWLPNN